MKRTLVLAVLVLTLAGWLAAPALPAAAVSAQVGSWQLGPPSTFQYQRFDGVFVPGPEDQPWANKVYFLGGRTSASTELPDIWSLDPVTGIYVDTGANMIQDVSNYNGHLIVDDWTGRGPAIYVVGGYDRDMCACNIATVQRYYPQTNQIEALATADDWPVKVAGYTVAGMGSAVVNDILYVWGGWENSVAPYFSSATWAFDIHQPSGGRWTNLNAPLSVGRTYIASAAQAGKIYSMGGISGYVGGDLVPTDVVEVLDTASPWNGWSVLAPLPVPTGEARGLGFDDDTLGLAPWDGKIYLAGGGDWPDGTAEVMEYDVAGNTWNQAFPDLINWRVNHAATFVPLCTADPNDGLPGMWVFGGRSVNGCDPPFAPTEFYALACGAEATMHIDKMKMNWKTGTPPYYKVIAQVRVYDQDNAPAIGAEVYGEWTNPDGQVVPVQGVIPTDDLGRTKFQAKEAQTGEYRLCVTDMALAGYVYDPGANQDGPCKSVVVGP